VAFLFAHFPQNEPFVPGWRGHIRGSLGRPLPQPDRLRSCQWRSYAGTC